MPILMELIDILITVVALGYIFKDIVKEKWFGFYQSVIAVSPAIILHELGHKFVAMAFGLTTELHASYFGLLIGIVLKAVSSPILFFIPAYVSIGTGATLLQSALIAFIGPGVNGLLWLICRQLRKRRLNMRTYVILTISQKVNGFLFIFNMIPIPPFDGFTVFSSLLKLFIS